MKRVLSIILFLCTVLILSGQQRFFWEKEKINDFIGKTTMVVLNGDNTMPDLLLRDAVSKNWTISPYEFCSLADFERLKTDSTYYFLIRVDGKHSKEDVPAMEFLTLLKGGEKAEGGINSMREVLSLPFQPLNEDDGRIFTYLPTYIKIIQSHVLKLIENNSYAYLGMRTYANAINDLTHLSILFSDKDFAYPVTSEEIETLFNGSAIITTTAQVDSTLRSDEKDKLVSLVIAPNIDQVGSYCYKMLIRADTKELIFFRKHKITSRNGKGFLKEDIRRLSTPFQLKH